MERSRLSADRAARCYALAALTAFALLARVVIAMWYQNSFDTEWYLMWAADLQKGFWNCYDGHVRQLDYPPFYLCLLRPVGALLQNPQIAEYMPYRMLLIKFWPVLFDTALIPAIYFVFRRRSESNALLGAALWAVNPAAIFNCACWGQTDGMMALLLLLAFAGFDRERPLWGTFGFAVACLTKMQCLYFAPVILFWFVRRRQWARLGQALALGFGTVIAVFLPFMIASGNPLAIFEVYFGGFGSYPYVVLNAFNLWGIWNLNWVNDSLPIFGAIPYMAVGTLLMLGCFAGSAAYDLRARRANVWLSATLLMQSLFILTMRQHERYQFIVMLLLLAAWLTAQRPALLGLFGGVSVVAFFNQALLLDKNIHQNAPWTALFPQLQSAFSGINVLLFAATVAVCVRAAGSLSGPEAAGGKETVQ